MYSITENKITFDNGNKAELPYPVKKIIEYADTIIILIDVPIRVIYTQNVYAYTANGIFLWQVKDRKYPGGSEDCPFTNIFINKENKLVLFNWCDVGLVVDAKTGEILSEYEHR
jgi:hypothetical protein